VFIPDALLKVQRRFNRFDELRIIRRYL
jgi:hypothetical protein